YNCEKWLGPALDSLIAQTRADWEAVVVDDGSTDDSAAVAREYAARDPRIRLVQQPNGGVGSARNHGAREAKGRRLVFFDADDLLHPEFIRVMSGVLDANPGANGCACEYNLFDDSGMDLLHPLPGKSDRLCVADMYDGAAWTIHAGMITRELFDTVGGFDTSLKNSDDWDFWLRALVHGDFIAVRQTLAHYRRHPAQKSRNYRRIARHQKIVTDKFLRMYPEFVDRYGRRKFQEGVYRLMMSYAWLARRDGLIGASIRISLEALAASPWSLAVIKHWIVFWTPLFLINFYRGLRGQEALDR
ncbi:glycosyltransferase family 2 protein, partial [bacterium]|nr:glycosyltransferase family 2 protein [bacterium]